MLQHRDELAAQNLRKFRAVNPGRSTSLYTADAKSWRGDTTFAMTQTLTRHLSSIPKLDALIIDEAHHAAAAGYLKIVEAVKDKNPDCKIFGVTATPRAATARACAPCSTTAATRSVCTALWPWAFWSSRVPSSGTLGGTDEKLASLRKTRSGEYDMHKAAEVLDLAVHNEAVVREWRKLAGDRKTIVFCSTVEHARHVLEAFLAQGARAALVTGRHARR